MVPAPPPRRRPTGSGNTNAAALKAARLRSRTCSSINNGCDYGSDDDCDPRPYADDMHHRYTTSNSTSNQHLPDEQRKRQFENVDEQHYSDADDDDYDEEDDVDDDDVNLLRCLHCHTESTEIQVRCDECSAYICDSCHWCHEFQANHEIRVCDRCDAFYCRACDEVDQCDDCAEVVCASCSTLLSCKFCGGGICEECATACGRCGIVLCSRDAKFAVECDTCRLPYCLVCLASGTKDPCVRCRTRPSKRMEQLVHLRLKSIYKAFKQNSSANVKSSNPRERQNDDPDDDHHMTDDPEALFQAAASAAKNGAQKRGRKHKSTDSTTGGGSPSINTMDRVNRFKEEKEKADAAATALLAELEEEEEAEKVKQKKKKKKRKVKPLSKEDDKVDVHEIDDDDESSLNDDANVSGEEACGSLRKSPILTQSGPQSVPKPIVEPAIVDPLESELCRLVANEDIDGLETLLDSIKGIPGRAVLRKNAKKAMKRLRVAIEEELEEDLLPVEASEEERKVSDIIPVVASTSAQPMESLDMHGKLKIVSYTHKKPPAHPSSLPNGSQSRASHTGALRSECVMRIAPIIVGWVIGKGGQRIRDLMEESGARIWIDQNNLGAQDHRSVYVVGPRRNVETAVELIKGLVSKAPPISSPKSRQVPPVVEPAGLSLTSSSAGRAPSINDAIDGNGVILKPNFAASIDAGCSPSGNDGRTRHVMTCEPRFVPLLIGRRGWTIKNIQDTTGVKVDIDQSVSPRKITISGGVDDNVQKAIRMVRDVLSYPHAQLPVGMDDDGIRESVVVSAQDTPTPSSLPLDSSHGVVPSYSSLKASEKAVLASPLQASHVVLRSHSPPSSLIMARDARTTSSTASSLSTTPEPNVQSTPVSPFQIVDASLMPSSAHSREVISGCRYGISQTPFSQSPHQSAMNAPPIIHPQQPVPDYFAPLEVGFESLQLPGQLSHQMGHVLQRSSPSQHNRATFSSVGQNEFGSMLPESALPIHGPASFPQQNSYYHCVQSQMANTPVKHNPTFWNGANNPGEEFHDRSDPDGFHLNAAVEFLQHSHQSNPMQTVAQNVNNFMGLPASIGERQNIGDNDTLLVHRGGDDAQMIDSLFGPGPAVSGNSLLTGLQGISLNGNVGSTGLWGQTDTSDTVDLSGLSRRPLGPTPEAPMSFSDMQAPLQPTERKAQSRFAWGEHNGFS